ncbi:phospholipase D alpha 1 [Tanacetum coccineum]
MAIHGRKKAIAEPSPLARDPRDVETIERLHQRIQQLEGNPRSHGDHHDNPLLTKETESKPIIWDIGDEEEGYPFVNKYPIFQEEHIMLMEEESCPVYDIDNEEEEELMPVYDTDIENVIVEPTKTTMDPLESILIQIDEDYPQQEPNAYTDSILILIKDNNPIGLTLIGRAYMPVSELIDGDEVDKWLEIMDEHKNPIASGAKIHAKLQFFDVTQDHAHVPEDFIPKIPLANGKSYHLQRCWEDVFDAITNDKHFIYITGCNIQNLQVSTMFTHHQKIIVVDHEMPNDGSKRRVVSFVGGIDLCDGRYDSAHHPLFKTLHSIHHNDFHQPNYTGAAIAKRGPHEPWHEIHSCHEGPNAWDVLFNFDQRWRKQSGKDVLLFRSIDGSGAFGLPDTPKEAAKAGLVSGKDNIIDRSIQDAYIQAIRKAKNFIFIENQYFLRSSFVWKSNDININEIGAWHLIPKELSLKIVSKIKATSGHKSSISVAKSSKRSRYSILEVELDNLRKELSSLRGGIFPQSISSTQQLSILFSQKPETTKQLEKIISKLKTQKYGDKMQEVPNNRTVGEDNGFVKTIRCKNQGMVTEAENIMIEMIKEGVEPDTTTYTVFIDTYGRLGHVDSAFDVLKRMVNAKCEPSYHTYAVLVKHLLHKQKLKNLKFEAFDINIGNVWKLMDLETAMELFSEMVKRGCELNVKTYEALTIRLCKEGRREEACRLVSHMLTNGPVPNENIYTHLVNCSCYLRMYEQALDLLSTVVENRILPNLDSYQLLIFGLYDEGKHEQGKEVFSNLLKKAILHWRLKQRGFRGLQLDPKMMKTKRS